MNNKVATTTGFSYTCQGDDCPAFRQCEQHGPGANQGFPCPVTIQYNNIISTRMIQLFGEDGDDLELLFKNDFMLAPLMEQLLVLRMHSYQNGKPNFSIMKDVRHCITVIDKTFESIKSRLIELRDARTLSKIGLEGVTDSSYYALLTEAASLPSVESRLG